MMDQLQQDNGNSLMDEKDKEKGNENDIKEKEKGKQLAEDNNNVTKVEISSKPIITTKDKISSSNSPCDDDMAIDEEEGDESDDNKNNDNNNITTTNNNADDQHCTLQDLSELACKIESDQKDNGHVATCVTGHVTGHAQGSASDDDNTPLPLWVKWRGKWQTGIRCPSQDCPSSTLKAKPTHEMKSYVPVFFPRSKAYCWISTLHSKPITEAPEPLKNGTHAKWRKMVREYLEVTRCHAVGKLALAMMSLTDQLHVKAVIEEATKGEIWKEFALEASKCKEYSDLGSMLVKLRNMILSDYISSDWLKTKFDSWVKNCQNAQNAESLEHLTEELVQNILWKRIEELWTRSTTHPDPNPEWKTLKQDMTKLFITSREKPKRPITNPHDPFDPSGNSETPQQIIAKRPKLEIRRPGQETNLTDNNKPLQISDPFDPLQSTPNKSSYTYRQCVAFIESKGRQCERWANDKDIYCCVHLHASSNGSDKRVGFANPSDPLSASKGYTYRQCTAFIESKGRQCERWASDSEIYCCVHLNSNNNSSDKRVGFGTPSDPLRTPNPNPQSKSGYTYRQCAAFIESKGRQCERWASENEIHCCVHLHASGTSSDKRVGFVSTNPPDPLSQTPSKSGYTYRQCGAFIEAKGRQCERWANDNDLYCCVHLNVRVDPVDRRAPLDSPLCRGTTTNGTNCKHRAKPGSDYCKKHRVDLVNHVSGNVGSSNVKSESGMRVISFGTESMGSQSGQISFVPTPVPITVPVFFENKPEIRNNNIMNKNNINYDNKNDVYTPNLASTSGDMNISELRCIGERANANENFSQCFEYAKKYELYCQNHIPKFLKRARDGRSRPITKEVILSLLKTCPSRKEKLLLHRACELLYGFLKSKLLVRKPKFDMSDKSEILFNLVSKDPELGEYLVKLISHEREKLSSVWGLSTNNNNNVNNNNNLRNNNNNINNFGGVKCKFCFEGFSDDQALTLHWTQEHKKEARWLFRGYACKLCSEGFNNRKLLESHIVNKHGASESVQGSTLFRCICCDSRFPSPDPLWQHVLAFHVAEFRLSENNNNNVGNNNVSNNVGNNVNGLENVNNDGNNGSFTAHRRGKYQLNRFKFKKSNNNNNQNNLKNMVKLASNMVNNNINNNNNAIILREMGENENVGLGALTDSDCADVARVLFSEIRKSNPHPSNLEILSLAREACCRTGLRKKLEEKFGILQNENVYLKAAKLCSEADVAIEWFKDGFVCLNGCGNVRDSQPVLDPLSGSVLLEGSCDGFNEFEGEDYHVVLDSKRFEELNWEGRVKEEELGLGLGFVLLCEDLSFGKEKFAIPCFVDDQIRVSVQMPWKDFTYVTERVINPPIDQPTNDEELGCGCSNEGCSADKCDHAYLFENDYENAIDINGESMHGKFAYDQIGRVILQEGFPMYECNSSCKCDASCQNRVVQNGVHVKLEVFRSKSKGWAVRAGEAITRGTFICEIIGEVVNNDEATQRRDRQRKDGCDYLCEIEAHMGHAKGMMSEETLPYVIDSFKFGNISRFINHSCFPNLSSYVVLSESMDCQLAHVALFANRDINTGEELGYDYRYKIIDGFDGEKCNCGAQNCRGRIY
ncbi:hypothetical protein LUZ60_011518 [Juncus effusus]|nr:hypothetical protein LUZ60_011518 [Juncus effusus]